MTNDSRNSKIKIFCQNGKPVYITKTRLNGIRLQIIKDIKQKRRENPNGAIYWFYGLAHFSYIKETDETVLVITYGDELSSLGLNKRARIYVEVPFKRRTTKKHGTVIC
jgi:hypothetical protein